jgi:uncharacterized protein with HEPN domain
MTQQDDATRVQHMVDAAERAIRIATERGRQDLRLDEIEVLAIVRLLEIVGEAARSLTPQLREKYPEVPWRQMIGTRN